VRAGARFLKDKKYVSFTWNNYAIFMTMCQLSCAL